MPRRDHGTVLMLSTKRRTWRFRRRLRGLSLLARLQPDLIKTDMELVRNIDASLSKAGNRRRHRCHRAPVRRQAAC
jgi:hypothetical protein